MRNEHGELERASPPRVAGLVAQVDDAVERAEIDLGHELGAAVTESNGGRGRRVRSLVLLLSAECARGASERSASLATVVELIHSASLAHNRVLDRSAGRNGEAKWRNQTSILLGDYLLATAFGTLAANGNMEFLPDLIGVIAQMCEGQVRSLRRGRSIAAPEYLEVLRMTAGSLTAFSARAGILTADGAPECAESLGLFGERFGVAFHIAGEILDLLDADSDGTAAARAFDPERWFPLPLVLLAQEGDDARAALRAIAAKDELVSEDVRVVRQLAEETGALSQCWQTVDSWLSAALAQLARLPNSDAKDLLVETATDLCSRRHYAAADR